MNEGSEGNIEERKIERWMEFGMESGLGKGKGAGRHDNIESNESKGKNVRVLGKMGRWKILWCGKEPFWMMTGVRKRKGEENKEIVYT